MANKQNIKIQQSLYLLKENAFNADFNEATFVNQKFINKNDAIPINSQPSNIIIILLAKTNKSIPYTNIFISISNLIK